MCDKTCVDPFLEETIQVVVESQKKCLAKWESWFEENSIRQPVKEEDFTNSKRQQRSMHQRDLSCKVDDCSAAAVKQILKEKVENYDFMIASLELMRDKACVNPFLEETIQVLVQSRKGCHAECESWLEENSIRQPLIEDDFTNSERQQRTMHQRGLSHKVENHSESEVKQILKTQVQDYGFVFASLKAMRDKACVDPFLEETIQVVVQSHESCLAKWESWLKKHSIRQPVKEEDLPSYKRQQHSKRQRDLSRKVDDCTVAAVKQILQEQMLDYRFVIASLELMRKRSCVDLFLEETIQVVTESHKVFFAEWESWLENKSIRQPVKEEDLTGSKRQRCS
ncbi:unnamed protein product [Candidula unifasciata]|uniref:Uncharacterized protein n=1 Tax=Candidula unifasciata TaxID=100452 RepID=A0A8S3YVI2_9EUPU|nr:unnamed protein product [Candidula unifasciata]